MGQLTASLLATRGTYYKRGYKVYEAKQDGQGYWGVSRDGKAMGTWVGDRIPQTREQCKDAARRLNEGATINELPHLTPKEAAQYRLWVVARNARLAQV